MNQTSPDGLVAAPAKRGALVYAPLLDTRAVNALRKGVSALHESSGPLRVFSALYLFKDGHWTVFQAPVKRE